LAADFPPEGPLAAIKLEKQIDFLPNHGDEGRKPKDGQFEIPQNGL
jgi:hypothetical protein